MPIEQYFASMNIFDLLILIPVLWGFWRGFSRGIIMELATLAAFLLGAWGGMHLSDAMANIIRNLTDSKSPYVPLLAFALVFVGVLMIVYGVAKLVERFVEAVALGLINKITGGIFGALKYLLVLSTVFFALDAVEKNITIIPPQTKNESLLYRPVAKIAPVLIPGLRDSELGQLIPGEDESTSSPAADSTNSNP